MDGSNAPPPDANAGDATVLLARLRSGERGAEDQLYELLQHELRGLARLQLRGRDPGHTLQPTALVNEAWIRLAKSAGATPRDRAHFLAIAGRAMRTALVDHARRKGSIKRHPGGKRESAEVALDRTLELCSERGIDPLDLDDALTRLAQDEPRQARLIELRFFGGLTRQEAAEVLEVSRATVARDWEMARLWLIWELGLAE